MEGNATIDLNNSDVLAKILQELKTISYHLAQRPADLNTIPIGQAYKINEQGPPQQSLFNSNVHTVSIPTYQAQQSNTQSGSPLGVDDSRTTSQNINMIDGQHLNHNSVLQIYYSNEVQFRVTGHLTGGTFETQTLRTSESEEESRWTDVIGESWRIPEDGRSRLSFSKRWLLSVKPDIAMQHLRDIVDEDKLIGGWLGAGPTTIIDLFDNGHRIVWAVGSAKKDTPGTGMKRANPVSGSSGKQVCHVSAPWNRLMFVNSNLLIGYYFHKAAQLTSEPSILSGIEPRKRCLVHELGTPGRRVTKDKQYIPRLKMGDSSADNIFFQIKFFEIQNVSDSQNKQIPWYLWKTGKLHSDRDDLSQGFKSGYLRRFIESSYTLQGVSPPIVQSGLPTARVEHWTVLEVRPITFAQITPDLLVAEGTEPLLEAMLMYVQPALLHISSKWTQIHEYFDNLVSEKVAYLDPDYHDTLLVDDEAFSRSKKYFWAISTLKVLDVSISDNITQIRKLLDTKGGIIESDPKVLDNLTAYRRSIQSRLNELEAIAQKFRGKIDEVIYLRDGLFNASAVMETRTSTRLNENLRLLTFVSIFFLPLSFCMSIWSINNQLFSLSSLAIVVTCISLATYFTVFNLDRLMYKYQSLHGKFVKCTVDKMKLERRQPWTARANTFEKFLNIKDAEHPPSNWILVQYRLQKLLIRPRVRNLYKTFIDRTIKEMKSDKNQRWVSWAEAFEKAQISNVNGEKAAGQSNWRLVEYRIITLWRRVYDLSAICKGFSGKRPQNPGAAGQIGATIA